MRTAEEIHAELSNAHDHATPECCCERCKNGHEAFILVSDIQSILDEAVAHGMTLAAEECFKLRLVYEAGDETIPAEHAIYGETILIARDNKVWRNGGKMSD